MDIDNYNRRKKKGPQSTRKSEFDKRRTHEEVQQIKKDLINFAKTPWGQEWIDSILNIGRPYRMQRGIDYAKDEERIDNLIINKGQLFATVQGTAPTPYRVKINFEKISEEGWDIIINKLADKTQNLINLLGGILPEHIIDIFEDNGYPLFPNISQGLNATCSCPDQAIPCKHIASVILYVALVLDYDPFILLELRGMTKDDILKKLKLFHQKEESIEIKKEIMTEKEKDAEFSFNIPKLSINDLSNNMSQTAISEKIGFKFKKPGKYIETFENLGLPSNLENPKAFENVLRAIYRTVTDEIYKKSMEIEKK